MEFADYLLGMSGNDVGINNQEVFYGTGIERGKSKTGTQ